MCASFSGAERGREGREGMCDFFRKGGEAMVRRLSRSCSSGVKVVVAFLLRLAGIAGSDLAVSGSLQASVFSAAFARARARPSKALGVLNNVFFF